MPPTRKPLYTLVTIWLLAGTLDICSALVLVSVRTNKNPVIVFNYIASAIFGKEAYTGGMVMIVAGVCMHYLVALVFCAIFFLLYPRLHAILKSKWICAIVVGVTTWCVMNLAVVPLSRIGKFPPNLRNVWENMAILIVAIGLPVALLSHQYYFPRKSSEVAR